MGDEYELDGELQDDDEEDEPDSAFDSSEDGDVEMDDGDEMPLAVEGEGDEDEEGGITTNLEDDLENDGYTLPAVDRGGEFEEHEHGTSLREVEGRMRWLVGVCMGKGEKVQGVPGR